MSRALIIHCGGRSGRGGEWAADEGLVLQATPILRVLADHDVTWVTSHAAAPLLWNNPLVDRVATIGGRTRADLAGERFDLVLNLEPTPGCCAVAQSVRARRRAGYTWDAHRGQAVVRETRTLALPLRGRAYQDWLFGLIDRPWRDERYVLGYRPRTREHYDIGLNHLPPGPDPARAWSPSGWLAIQRRIRTHREVTLPVSTSSVLGLLDWVNRCRTIVTMNSLGLHAALALGKQVVALLSPAEAEAVPLYGQGVAVTPTDGSDRLAGITPGAVHAAIEKAQSLRRAG